jgi:hypothetical protein
MYTPLFNEFLVSADSLQVYKDSKLLFSSSKDRLLPLLEYIERFAPHHRQVVVFDKIMGNAAALLSVEASCREVYSPLGSQLAVKTLEKYGIKYHITEIVPYIQQPNGEDMCPMEKLSLDKGPEEFYEVIRGIIK